MPHPAMSPGNVAVITGGASGIGLAAATLLAETLLTNLASPLVTSSLPPKIRLPRFSGAILSCQVNGAFDLVAPCREGHGRAAGAAA